MVCTLVWINMQSPAKRNVEKKYRGDLYAKPRIMVSDQNL